METTIDKLSKYIGIPCIHGRNDENGMSCLAIAHNVLKEFGVNTPALEFIDLPDDWYIEYPHLIEEKALETGYEIFDIDNLQQADVLLFAMIDGLDVITHIGVMIDRDKFIHAVINTKSKVSRIKSKLWRDRLKRIIRMR